MSGKTYFHLGAWAMLDVLPCRPAPRSAQPGVSRMLWALRDVLCLVVWLSGNALVAINEVTLCQARLILGWVTVCGHVHHLGI